MALTVTSASATVIISDDVGGKMQDYTTHFQQVRNSSEPSSFPALRFGLHRCSVRPERPNLRHPKAVLGSMPHGCSITRQTRRQRGRERKI